MMTSYMAGILFSLAVVAAGCESGDPADPGLPGGPDFTLFDEVVGTAVSNLGLEGAAAVVVHRDLGIVHVRGYGSFDEDRLFLIASSSKPLSVGVLMRLADQQLVDLDAPIGRYVGDAWGDEKAALTIAQLLSNSSGMVGLTDNPAYAPYRCQYSPDGSLNGCAREIYEADDADRVVPPDTRFRYGGGQWQLAGAVAEIVSGRSWQQLVRETYVEPCGTTSLGYTNPFGTGSGFRYPDWFDADGANLPETDNPSIEAGAYITVEDYGELLLMHLRGGRCGERVVLSPGAVERMREDRIAAAYGGAAPHPTLEGYGLGWWIDREHDGVVASPGLYGAMPWLDVERGYGAFVAIEASADEREQLWQLTRPILDAVFDEAAARPR